MVRAAEAQGLPPLDATVAAGGAADATTALMAPAFSAALTSPDLPARVAELLRVERHGLVRRPGNRKFRIDRSDTPWQPTRWSSGTDDGAGPRTTGHLGAIPRAAAELRFRLPAGAGVSMAPTLELVRAWYGPAIEAPWHLVTPAAARAVAALDRAGAAIVHAALVETPEGAVFAFVAARVPRARLDAARAGDARSATTISEHVALALAALEGDDAGPARPDLLGGERAGLEQAGASAAVPLREFLAAAGAALPDVDGSRRTRLRAWPAYETLAAEGGVEALRERAWLDFRLAVVAWLGRAGLPGAVGADVALQGLAEMADGLVLETERDWEGVAGFIGRLDDAFFDGRMRRCLADGVFVVRPS
jgi:hypothetical protein